MQVPLHHQSPALLDLLIPMDTADSRGTNFVNDIGCQIRDGSLDSDDHQGNSNDRISKHVEHSV